MSEVTNEVVTTAEAIQGFDDTIRKVAETAFRLFTEQQENNERAANNIDAPLRFDVAAVQPGAGFKVLVVILRNGAFDIETHAVLNWITKNVHYVSGDELRTVPMIFDEWGNCAEELRSFLVGIREPHDYRILIPGVNEIDPEELQEIKQSLAHENKSRNDEIERVNAERAKSAEMR
jgi:hypothetical protein